MSQVEVIDEASKDYGKKTISNVIWSYLSFFVGKFLTFIVTAILARILSVDEFGLMGYCLIGIQYLDILSRFGLDTALISRRDRLEESTNTILILSIITGIFFFTVAWLIAPFLAEFFNDVRITELFRVLSIVLLIDSIAIVHSSLIRKQLNFRKKLIPDMGKNLMKGGVSIGMALSGYGVWSLVWGQVASSAFTALILWIIVSWRPSFKFDRQVAREILGFGLNMNVIQLIGALRSNVDYIFVGRVLGAASLGIYTIAYRLPELIVRNVNDVVGSVTHPVMSQIAEGSEEFTRYYLSYMRYISVITFATGFGMAIIAEAFILTVYTDKWAEAIYPMQTIAIALAIHSVSYIPGVLYKATNRPHVLTRVHLIKLPVLLVGLWYSTQFGLTGVATAQLLLACFYVTVDTLVASRSFNVPLVAISKSVMPATVSAILMGGTGLLLANEIKSNDVVELLILVPFGAIVYGIALYLLDRTTFVEVINLVKSAVKKRRKKKAK